MVGPIAAAAITAGLQLGTSFLSSKLNKKKKEEFSAPGFDAGGLFGEPLPGGGFKVSSSGARNRLVGDVANTFPEQANITRGLRGSVTPGFSALRESRLSGIENRRNKAIGNLRENLARRRVLGSSFGGDALTRSEVAFEQEADRVRSETFLQELDATNKLTQQEFAERRQEFTTRLDELNLQAEIASKFAQNATSTLAANARLKQELDARESRASGQAFGQALKPVISAVGDRISPPSPGSIGPFTTTGTTASGVSI